MGVGGDGDCKSRRIERSTVKCCVLNRHTQRLITAMATCTKLRPSALYQSPLLNKSQGSFSGTFQNKFERHAVGNSPIQTTKSTGNRETEENLKDIYLSPLSDKMVLV